MRRGGGKDGMRVQSVMPAWRRAEHLASTERPLAALHPPTHPPTHPPAHPAGMLVLCRRAKLGATEMSDAMLLTLMW